MPCGAVGVSDEAALIACPTCDTLQHEVALKPGERSRCVRCGTTLATSRRNALTRITMMAASALVLMVAGISFPFLKLNAKGLHQQTSLLDTARAFDTGILVPLVFVLFALIVFLPLVRFVAILYVAAPMALGWRPARGAAAAFRLSERLRPWAMAEVFVVGVVVALVKISDMAEVTLGPSFFALATLVVVNVLYDQLMCRFTVWKTLETRAS